MNTSLAPMCETLRGAFSLTRYWARGKTYVSKLSTIPVLAWRAFCCDYHAVFQGRNSDFGVVLIEIVIALE